MIQVEALDLLVALAVEQRLHVIPIVRTDPIGLADTRQVLPLGGIERKKAAQRVSVLLRAICPECFDRIPESPESLIVPISILDDQRLNPIRAPHCNSVPDGGAVVHQVKTVCRYVELVDQSLDDLGKVIEGVFEVLDGRHVALPETGIIGRYHVLLVRERRNEFPEHVRRRRKTVKQNDRGVLA